MVAHFPPVQLRQVLPALVYFGMVEAHSGLHLLPVVRNRGPERWSYLPTWWMIAEAGALQIRCAARVG